MGSLAQLALQAGYEVSGSDQDIYPPMSDQLIQAGIPIHQGYQYDPQSFQPDLVIVGNALSRGTFCIEALLNSQLAYTSGPQWLHEHLLKTRWVLGVAGTHGKTTTASLLAWILESAGLAPGFLIGGVAENFGISARLGETPFFVIEADEYDTAFFDKGSKFLHYHPRTLIINNLEFDHADIFSDLAAIQRQFHYLVRTLPAQGLILYPQDDQALDQVFAQGCWTPTQGLSLLDPEDNKRPAHWWSQALTPCRRAWRLGLGERVFGECHWSYAGEHMQHNALAAIAAARHVGVTPEISLQALQGFQGVKRRMQLRGEVAGRRVFDDFAHHPTAIKTTLAAARATYPEGRLLAVIEPRSNTMKLGTLKAALAESVQAADQVYWYQSEGVQWSLDTLGVGQVYTQAEDLLTALVRQSRPQDTLVLMSNGSFSGLHTRLLEALAGLSS